MDNLFSDVKDQIKDVLERIKDSQKKADSVVEKISKYDDYWGSADRFEAELKPINSSLEVASYKISGLHIELEYLSTLFDSEEKKNTEALVKFLEAKLAKLGDSVKNAKELLKKKNFWVWAASLVESLSSSIQDLIDRVQRLAIRTGRLMLHEAEQIVKNLLPSHLQ